MSTTHSTNDPITKHHYGVHWTQDGIAFLEQGSPRGGSNALGLPQKSPFRIVNKEPCNHNIPLAAPVINKTHTEAFSHICSELLCVAMKPIPKAPEQPSAWFIEDPADKLAPYLACLSRMSSPIRPIVRPAWAVKPGELESELGMSNVQPLVISTVEPKHTELVKKAVSLAAHLPRRLIITGDPRVPIPQGVDRITSTIMRFNLSTLIVLPWESLGATFVRRYMRGEPTEHV